jgi:subtilisin-like proprotein convertase family protein
VGQRIPDQDPVGLTDSLQVLQRGRLTDLNVSVTASHAHVGDLVVRLTHVPTGTTATLLDRPGVPATLFGCEGSNIAVTLDDAASAPVDDACRTVRPALSGTLRPDQALDAFTREDVHGLWTLTVADHAAEDQGRLTAWCLLPTTTQRFALQGAVTGIVPQRVTCTNQTTGQELPLLDGAASWNCTEAGLLARRGERVRVRLQGRAVVTLEEPGGVAAGLTSRTAVCRNATTGQTVHLDLQGATSWNCTAAGLESTPGDGIVMVVSGTAD